MARIDLETGEILRDEQGAADADDQRALAEQLLSYLFDGAGSIPDVWKGERLRAAKAEYEGWIQDREVQF